MNAPAPTTSAQCTPDALAALDHGQIVIFSVKDRKHPMTATLVIDGRSRVLRTGKAEYSIETRGDGTFSHLVRWPQRDGCFPVQAELAAWAFAN